MILHNFVTKPFNIEKKTSQLTFSGEISPEKAQKLSLLRQQVLLCAKSIMQIAHISPFLDSASHNESYDFFVITPKTKIFCCNSGFHIK